MNAIVLTRVVDSERFAELLDLHLQTVIGNGTNLYLAGACRAKPVLLVGPDMFRLLRRTLRTYSKERVLGFVENRPPVVDFLARHPGKCLRVVYNPKGQRAWIEVV